LGSTGQRIHAIEGGSDFTLLMEGAMLTLAKQMAIAPLAAMALEHDTGVWRVVEHHVHTAWAGLDFSSVTKVGGDETSARRGHDYVPPFMDLEACRVMFATPGKDEETDKAFSEDRAAHGGEPTTQVEAVICDMSAAYIAGSGSNLADHPEDETARKAATPVEADERNATTLDNTVNSSHPSGEGDGAPAEPHSPRLTFDPYHHVVAKANEAVDQVQRIESKTRLEFKRFRYV